LKCPECGKEISDKASSCPDCECPIEIQKAEVSGNISDQPITEQASNKKIIPIVIALVVVVIISAVICNVKVIRPRKLEAQNRLLFTRQ